jgi:hypothetical protein
MPRKVLAIKIPGTLLAEIDATVARFVHTRVAAPLTRNAFIERAIVNELKHLARSSKRKFTTDIHPGEHAADCKCGQCVMSQRRAVGNTGPFAQMTAAMVRHAAVERRLSQEGACVQ